MADIVDIEVNSPHIVHEVVCLKCLHRYVAVAPQKLPLRLYDCETCGPGFIISTGQWELPGDAPAHDPVSPGGRTR